MSSSHPAGNHQRLHKHFEELANPQSVRRILRAARLPLLAEMGTICAADVRVLQSYHDDRSYNLAAKYTVTVRSKNKERIVDLLALSHPGGRKKYAYDIIRAVSARFPTTPSLTFPKAYAYLPAFHLALTEYAPGQTLLSRLKSKKTLTRGDAERVIHWLMAFQRTRVPARIIRPMSFKQLKNNIAILQKRNHPFVADVEKRFQRERSKMEAWARRGTDIVHGDFNPANIIISQNTITAIDFEYVSRGDGLMDIARFETYISLILQSKDVPAKRRRVILATFQRAHERISRPRTRETRARLAVYREYYTMIFQTHHMIWGAKL
ncbi:MAG: phosphotransferase [Candidatus Kerfeldbacteria bacterium]|nr:phosphotransferase [Candidatus Kerfeldbacteria bacterium]